MVLGAASRFVLRRVVVPDDGSAAGSVRTKMSDRLFVSTATRLDAEDTKATVAPSPEMVGPDEAPLPPVAPRLTSTFAPVRRSKR